MMRRHSTSAAIVFFSIAPISGHAQMSDAELWDAVIQRVVIYDDSGIATACPKREDLFWIDSQIESARFDYQTDGTLMDPAIIEEGWGAGCIFLRKGSSGQASRDADGNIIIHVDVAELGDDQFELDAGWYYLRAQSIRSDVDTIVHFD